ncbi:MAG: hypothetical protein PVH89_06980 [Gammaproteobacteria bacterium]
MKLQSFALALAMVPVIAAAQSDERYQCTMGELTRRVAIERQGDAPVPCEVAYYKDSEAPGERQVLWNAAVDTSYCGSRAAEFVSRLEGLGWSCVAAAPAEESARSEDAAE